MNRLPSCCTVCHNTSGTAIQSLTYALGSTSFNTTLHHKMINKNNLFSKRANCKLVHSNSRKCKRSYLVFEIRGGSVAMGHGIKYCFDVLGSGVFFVFPERCRPNSLPPPTISPLPLLASCFSVSLNFPYSCTGTDSSEQQTARLRGAAISHLELTRE
jgi:hypothetical protein